MKKQREMSKEEIDAEVVKTTHTKNREYIFGKNRYIGQADGTLAPICRAEAKSARYDIKELMNGEDGDRKVAVNLKRDLKTNISKIVIKTTINSSGNKSAVSISKPILEQLKALDITM